jgi:hypothetical protein
VTILTFFSVFWVTDALIEAGIWWCNTPKWPTGRWLLGSKEKRKNIFRNHGNHAGNITFLTILTFFEGFCETHVIMEADIWSCNTPKWPSNRALLGSKEKKSKNIYRNHGNYAGNCRFLTIYPFFGGGVPCNTESTNMVI